MAIVQQRSPAQTGSDYTSEISDNQQLLTGNYIGIVITVLVLLIVLSVIVLAIRKRRQRKQHAEMLANTGESFSADELHSMKHTKTGRTDFSAGRIMGF